MHDSRRYRYNAAECLLAAQEAREPYGRKLRLSMAVSWLLLARQDEAMGNLLARWDMAKHVKLTGSERSFLRPLFQGTGFRPALRREGRAAQTPHGLFILRYRQGTSNNTRFRRFLPWLSERLRRSRHACGRGQRLCRPATTTTWSSNTQTAISLAA
jgi:hypothetical protein